MGLPDDIERAPAFQLYARDWHQELRRLGLTLEETGALFELVLLAWSHHGVPDDDAQIARILRVPPAKARRLMQMLRPAFVEVDGRLTHPLIEGQREVQRRRRNQRAEAGRRSGEARRRAAAPVERDGNDRSTTVGAPVARELSVASASASASASAADLPPPNPPQGDMAGGGPLRRHPLDTVDGVVPTPEVAERAHQFLKRFAERHEAVLGAAYPSRPGRDFEPAKTLVATYSDAQLEVLVEIYWRAKGPKFDGVPKSPGRLLDAAPMIAAEARRRGMWPAEGTSSPTPVAAASAAWAAGFGGRGAPEWTPPRPRLAAEVIAERGF